MRDWVRQLTALIGGFLSRFSPRERIFLSLGLIASAGLLGYHFFLSPVLERLKILDRLIAQKQEESIEMSRLRGEYLAVAQKVSAMEARVTGGGEGFSLFSYVEGVADQGGVKENIVFIRPQPEQSFGPYREIGVEVKVEALTLAQMVQFLDLIEQSPQLVRIKRLHLKKQYSDPRLLNGTFVVASYEGGG